MRNKIKRRIRHILIECQHQLVADDFVIIARKGVEELSYQEMKQNLIHVLKLAKLYQEGVVIEKKVKWAGLLVASLIVLTACGTGPVTSQSTDAWDRLIYWFASIIQFLSINGQIGIGIILFTILIRTLLLPLFQIQMNSSRKMQELQPQLKKLQAEYPGTDMESRQQLYEATQALYKENGVSMRASMIPLFIQMPILLALFQALTRVGSLESRSLPLVKSWGAGSVLYFADSSCSVYIPQLMVDQ